ncbi:MAG TPA: serine/threonine-protein kinase [Polyangiaceae bacterium]|jgi:serine/threonine-protein kinase
MQPASSPLVFGRYTLHGVIASGGMATVHYGRLRGPVGFSRTVAIKRLHSQVALDPDFVAMFVDEARLAARIRHPNVVQTVDIVAEGGELLLVMDYVPGESLAQCLRAVSTAQRPIPGEVVSAIACGLLHGLDAAHEATGESGEALLIVHRDVSPQNVLVGADGVPRVLDFGVAKAVGRIQTTREGQLKGKLAYMAPEQLRAGDTVDRRTDVYAAGVVLWETLTRQRLFFGDNEGIVIRNVLERQVEPPSAVAGGVDPCMDAIVLRALDRAPERRFPTARAMALEIETRIAPASATRVASWLAGVAGDRLAMRAAIVAEIERASGSTTSIPPAASPVDADAVATKTQVSGISVARSTEPSTVTPLVRRAVLTGAAALGVGLAISLALLVRRAGPEAPSASTPPSPPASTSPLTGSPPAVASTPALSPEDALDASLVVPATITIPALRPATASPARAPTGPHPCGVRSYVDGAGIKHYVRDCK